MFVKNLLYATILSAASGFSCQEVIPETLPAGVEEVVKSAAVAEEEKKEASIALEKYLGPSEDNYKIIVSGKKAVYIVKIYPPKQNCELYLLIKETRTTQKIIMIEDLGCNNTVDALYGAYTYSCEELTNENEIEKFNGWLKEGREKAFPTRNVPQELDQMINEIED